MLGVWIFLIFFDTRKIWPYCFVRLRSTQSVWTKENIIMGAVIALVIVVIFGRHHLAFLSMTWPRAAGGKTSMLARVNSGALRGVDAYLVEVEVDLAPGLPYFATVGLPEIAVKESKDRVRAALKNSGYKFPGNRVTINLAPADVRKEGTGFDLPVAVGILAAQGIVPPGEPGEVPHLRGAVPGRPPEAHPGHPLHGPGHPRRPAWP